MMEAEFDTLDPKAPATLANVAMAVVELNRFDEAELAELIARGEFASVFPFKPRQVELPPDVSTEEALEEASALPMDDDAYAALVQSSMPQSSTGFLRRSVDRIRLAISRRAAGSAQASVEPKLTSFDEK